LHPVASKGPFAQSKEIPTVVKSWQQGPAAAGGAAQAPVPVQTVPSAPGAAPLPTAVQAAASAV
jgi:hypothetical protein